MTRAVIYCRFSPRRNEGECESIEVQRDLCRGYCRRRRWPVEGEHEDRALSGAEEDRPGLWAAVEQLRKGWVLLVYKRDRLARDVYLSEYILREVAKRGARVESVVAEGNGDGPEAVLVRQVLAAFAEYERKAIAARTRAAMLRHQKAGRRMSCKPPYGWKVDPADPRRLVEDPMEQIALGWIREMKEEGLGLRQIASALSGSGVRPRGSRWHHGTVKTILARLEG